MINGIFFINQVIAALHKHFQKKNILLFSSPSLVKSAAMEPYLDAFCVQSQNSENYFLPTSPEFSLKKAFAFYPNQAKGIYDIAHAFRDEQISIWHRQQFTMAEWYCKESNYMEIPKQIISLLKTIEKTAKRLKIKTNISLPFADKNKKIYSVAELFQKFTDFVLTPQTNFSDLIKLAKKHNIYFHTEKKNPDADWLELYSVLFAQLIEPQIKNLGDIVFVKNYPPLTSAMSRLNKEGWASRIECYINGIEIANGYQELDDPVVLKSIWQQNNNMRLSSHKKIHPLDETLIELTPYMKNVCGIALGLERTLLALYSQYTIKDFYIT